MNRITQILIVILGLLALVAIRYFETSLFYDPLISFFKSDYRSAPLPSFELMPLLGHTAIRFVVNSGVSLFILWALFKKTSVVTFATLLYIVLGLLFMIIFYVLIVTYEIGNYQALFYVRRFLIQPLFLLLLVPAFYFQKQKLS